VTWTTACTDWADRLRARQSIIPPPLFQAEAERALEVFRGLQIVDAPGSPTYGDCCEQWVFNLVASIFGAYDAENGRRLITEWFLLVPKKNSKSTIAAGIMMTALILNWRQSAEFSIIAPTVEIANNSFFPARDMCAERTDEELSTLMQVQSHVKTITHRTSGATLKVLAADSNTVGGKKGVGTLIDELWLFGKMPNAENMLREATGGLASRPEGFTIFLSTQSDEPPSGVFRQKLNYARDVRDGKVDDPRFVPILYEFPDAMVKAGDHLHQKNWSMVNPNLNRSVDPEFLHREHKKAVNDGLESLCGFMAKHLNIEIGVNLRSDRWTGADYWDQQSRYGMTLDELLRNCEVVTIGIDGGGLDDLLGLAVLGREIGTGNLLVWNHAWADEKALVRRKAEASRYRDFAAAGDMTIVKGLPEDVAALMEIVDRVYQSGLLGGIGLDPSGVKQILRGLDELGIDEKLRFGVSQGWRLVGAIKSAERQLADGTLWHAGQALMAWAVGNAKVVPAGSAIRIDKGVTGAGKIDPLMATFNAIEVMGTNPVGVGGFAGFYATQAAAVAAQA
jgi:phage terminase large subunit-like protein